jgi:phosphoheptose isomerase
MNNSFPENSDYSLEEFFSTYLKKLNQSIESLDIEQVKTVVDALMKNIDSGATIYTCGNGGSSSIADHFVCDLVKGASSDSSVNPKVVPLLSMPLLTAIANDIGYEDIFSFPLSKYASQGDILLSVSSSGNSPNIVKAIETAKSLGVLTISFLGFEGGKAKELSDLCLHTPSDNYGVCEDAHHALMHILSQYIRLVSINNQSEVGKIKF